jgi:hypothetical protein
MHRFNLYNEEEEEEEEIETKNNNNESQNENDQNESQNENDNNMINLINELLNEQKMEEEEEYNKKMKEKENKNKFNFSLLDKEIIKDNIIPFLSNNDKLNFYSINKSYKKELINLISEFKENLFQIFELNEKVPNIEKKIENFKLTFKENKNSLINYEPGKNANKSFELLNENNYIKFFNENKKLKPELKEILILYKILFYLINENLIINKNDEIFWENCCNFILNQKEFGNFLKNKLKETKISDKNIFYINKLLQGKKKDFSPQKFTNLSFTTGLFAIIIKDVLEFYGILFNRKKSQPQQILNIYENEKNIYNRISNYLEKLNSI